VHIRRSPRNFPESWCLEIALACAGVNELPIAPGNAGVVQTLVGEIGTNMASDAVGLAAEELEPGLLLASEGGAVAVDEAVEWGVAGEDGSDEAGEGSGDFLRREVDAGGGFGEREVHFVGIFDGFEDLLFEAGGAAIPEEQATVAAVDEGRGVAAAFTSEYT
jgi:hypothetical protein